MYQGIYEEAQAHDGTFMQRLIFYMVNFSGRIERDGLKLCQEWVRNTAYPEVTVILSGMSNMEQMKDNIQTFQEDKPLSEEEMKDLPAMADEMVRKIVLSCTACHYCVSHCPQGLDIPTLLDLYNEHYFTGGGFIAPMALSSYEKDKLPSACIGCKSCEAVCPQQIKISEAMADFAEKLNM